MTEDAGPRSTVGAAWSARPFHQRAIAGLAVLGIGGTTVELWMLEHWNGFRQILPWVALLAVSAALVVAIARPSAVGLVRVVAGFVALLGAVGVLLHVNGNYESAPLDAVYGPKWDTMSLLGKLWASATGEVGPAPPLVPLVLAYVATMVLLLTVGTPANEKPKPASPRLSS